MKQPTPVFLSYMNFPYAIEGGSTKKFLGVLNKLCTAKREAILRGADWLIIREFVLEQKNLGADCS